MDTMNTRSGDKSPRSRQAAFHTVPASVLRRAILLAVASIASLVSTSLFTTAYAAEECYKDTAGRIVSRRRPGFVEVACPWRPFTYVGVGTSAAAQAEDADAGSAHKGTATPVSSVSKPAPLPRGT